LEIFCVQHCAMNRSFFVAGFPLIIICYGYVSEETICLSVCAKSR